MSTSKGRELAQAYIDSIKQYQKRTPTEKEVIDHITKNLPPSVNYTPRGAKCLMKWLKF